MVSTLEIMTSWSKKTEEELIVFLKDWLKNQGRTQADLCHSLQAVSTRMPALIEILKKEYDLGGLPKLAARLCTIEKNWTNNEQSSPSFDTNTNPFGQLDLLLQEIREDCDH